MTRIKPGMLDNGSSRFLACEPFYVSTRALLADFKNKVVKIKNGRVEAVEINRNPLPVERIEW